MLLYFLAFGCLVLQKSNAWETRLFSTNNSDDDNSYRPAAQWSNTFDWQLFKNVSLADENNVLISPKSLKVVLQLLYEGAANRAKTQIAHVLNLRNYYNRALLPVGENENVFKSGTRLFFDSSLQPKQTYVRTVQNQFHADVTTLNFTNKAESQIAINKWAENITNGHLKKLVDADDLEKVVLMIANAVYFKGKWRYQFPVGQVAEGAFYTSPTKTVQVQYMTVTAELYFTQTDRKLNARIVRLPYKGNQYAMFVLLPNERDGLNKLINNIDLLGLKSELLRMAKGQVRLRIPKFKFEYSVKYLEVLEKLGLRDVFQNTNSFPFISETTTHEDAHLTVSDIIQKSGIEIDEEGAAAYAVTGINLVNKFGEPIEIFNVSHPFAFFLEEQATGTIVFSGKVVNPAHTVENRFSNDQSVSANQNFQPDRPFYDKGRFNYFDLELLHSFSDSSENVLISPASVKVVLAMLLEGAGGESAAEIRMVLRLHPGDDISKSQLQTLLYNLNDPTGSSIIKSANAVFVSDKYKVESSYSNRLRTAYFGKVSPLDFSNPALAADNVNSWVNGNTNGLIREIVTPASLSADTVALIINALYFKGEWLHKFNEQYTAVKCFKSLTKDCVNVHMMNSVNFYDYNYIQSLDAQAVSLPYNDKKYAMLIILPSEQNTIQTLTRDIQHNGLASILSQLEPKEVLLELPRFEIEFSADLVEYLKTLRIRSIFGPQSNLSGIVTQDAVKISNFIHKTKLEVNEKGSEAAAVSGAVVVPLMGSSRARMVANHPFAFFIYHVDTLDVLFQGQLVEPKEVQTTAQSAKSVPYVPFNRGIKNH